MIFFDGEPTDSNTGKERREFILEDQESFVIFIFFFLLKVKLFMHRDSVFPIQD